MSDIYDIAVSCRVFKLALEKYFSVRAICGDKSYQAIFEAVELLVVNMTFWRAIQEG